MKEGILSRSYFFILCIYTFIIPQYNLEGDKIFNLYDVLFYGLLFFSVLQIFLLFIKGDDITPSINNKSILWLYIFFFLSLASYFWSEAYEPVKQFSQSIKILIVITPILFLDFRDNKLSTLYKFYFYGTILGSFQIVYNYYFNAVYDYGIKRSFLTGIDSNESAILIAIGFSLSLFYYFKNKNILYLISGIPQIIAVFFTGSRTGFVAVIVTLILALYFFKVFKLKPSSLIIVVILVVLFYLLPQIVPSENLNRIFGVGKDISNNDMSGRELIWAEAIILIPKKLFLGYGMNSFADVLENHFSRYNAHNVFLKTLFELGIPGIISFIMILVYSIEKIIKSKSANRNFLMMGFVITIISFLQLSWIYSINILVLMSFLIKNANKNDLALSESGTTGLINS